MPVPPAKRPESLVSRKVKIVCTLGPASSSDEAVARLVHAGMDVARLNFSHGSHEVHRAQFERVRRASSAAGRFVGVMQDLQGPKMRVGALPSDGLLLKTGDALVLHPEGAPPSEAEARGYLPLPISAEIAGPVSRDVRVGARILFDDGRLSSRVSSVRAPLIFIEIENGGLLTSRKGMNFPGTPLSLPCCTDKDFEDLKLGLELGVDAVALSFVRSAADIERVQELIRKNSSHQPLVIAKIEREEAVEDHESIIQVSDGLLVARGDMAVEVGAGRVPGIQKRLIRACNGLGVPIITATQMLESMIQSATPTRAEASDVANAVFDGTDAVMLSGETAAGAYPQEALRTMAEIVVEAEKGMSEFSMGSEALPTPGSIVESVEYSASKIAHHVGAVAIACITHSGRAARALAKYRPGTPIFAIMDREESLRKLSFMWGIQGLRIERIESTDDIFVTVERALMSHGKADPEDLIVVTAGVPTLRRGTTNMIKVHKIARQ
ncbi:MAG: pyruvate kinase [Bdellovibrionales bacterium]|nr:pyruvate kinase [Bdellovibrionales bacterium]